MVHGDGRSDGQCALITSESCLLLESMGRQEILPAPRQAILSLACAHCWGVPLHACPKSAFRLCKFRNLFFWRILSSSNTEALLLLLSQRSSSLVNCLPCVFLSGTDTALLPDGPCFPSGHSELRGRHLAQVSW